MAEEKKKTTSKNSEVKETKKEKEVKVEKKFCTKCGKELKNGEECSCNKEVITINNEALISKLKSAFNIINNVFKKPSTTINKESNNKDNSVCFIILGFLALSFALYLVFTVISFSKSVSSLIYGASLLDSIDISYFKVFIYGILIYALCAIIPMFSVFIVGKISKSSNLTFKNAFKLYTISNAPLIYTYLALALIMFINVNLLNILGIIGGAIISVFCFFNFLLAVNKVLNTEEDKRSWLLTALLTIWFILAVIVGIISISSVKVDTYDYNNNWNFKN